MVDRLTEAQCIALFERLLPHGLNNLALVQEPAPGGIGLRCCSYFIPLRSRSTTKR